MPREAPGMRSITPLRCNARRCSSAALADLKPSSAAISARVGGMPFSLTDVLDQLQDFPLARRQLATWRVLYR